MEYYEKMRQLIQGSLNTGDNLKTHSIFSALNGCFNKLWEQPNSLIQYIKHIGEVATVTLLYEAAESGIEASRKLIRICASMLNGQGISTEEKDYHLAISDKRDAFMQYSERQTILSLFFLELFDMHAEISWNRYKVEQDSKMLEFADLIELKKYHIALIQKLGADTEQKINDMLIETLVYVPVMKAFRQGMINEFTNTMIYMDAETGKPVFQLWMETL